MRNSKDLGRLGEKIAEDYFKESGYKLLAKNFRTPFGEIDLIFKKEDLLVFVEVKGSSFKENYLPEEKVNWRKKERILKSAEIFILKNLQKMSEIKNIRFDVVVVDLGGGEIKHYASAFYTENCFFSG